MFSMEETMIRKMILIFTFFTLLFLSCFCKTKSELGTLIIKEGLPVTDYDGNSYRTMRIGNQVWMLENLKCRHYRDGTPAKYYEYNNDSSLVNTYGRLYDRSVVLRNIAPEGWRVPSKSDWEELANNLGGLDVAGGKLKEQGTAHWKNQNTGATDEIGFCALPGGMHDFTGIFQWFEEVCCFSSTSLKDGDAAYIIIESNNTKLEIGGFHPSDAVSVRCVKNI